MPRCWKPQRACDPGNPSVSFHGEKRRNDTHESTTDPDAKLFRKGNGKEARLVYMGHVLMENRHGLAVMAGVTHATGTAERDAAAIFMKELRRSKDRRRITPGADKGYDTKAFVEELKANRIVPHIAQKSRSSAVDHRTAQWIFRFAVAVYNLLRIRNLQEAAA